MARRNSVFDTLPLLSSSHAWKRSLIFMLLSSMSSLSVTSEMTSPSPLDIADWSEVGACWSGGGAAGLAGVVSIAEICALRSAICSALFNG